MENASNALLMAAGVLIGIMILSIGVFLFVDFSGTSREIQDTISSNQLQQFNNQFTIYADRDDLTIYDVISVANLAAQNNLEYSEGHTNYIQIEYDGSDNYSKLEKQQDKYETLISTYNVVKGDGELQYLYESGSVQYNDIGRVKYIKFVRKENN